MKTLVNKFDNNFSVAGGESAELLSLMVSSTTLFRIYIKEIFILLLRNKYFSEDLTVILT